MSPGEWKEGVFPEAGMPGQGHVGWIRKVSSYQVMQVLEAIGRKVSGFTLRTVREYDGSRQYPGQVSFSGHYSRTLYDTMSMCSHRNSEVLCEFPCCLKT